MEISTKDKILIESLKLFSKNGYDGVSMRDIAAEVGIKGASLYNHFEGKQGIFEALFKEMERRYILITKELNKPQGNMSEIAEKYAKFNEQELQEIAEIQFVFYATDEFAAPFRRLLIAEQYRNELAKKTLNEYFFAGPIGFQGILFSQMKAAGGFKNYEAKVLAVEFYSPIFFLLLQYDQTNDLEACLDILKRHVSQFLKMCS